MKKPAPTVREFEVTTDFQLKALRPGGLSLSDALQKAEQNLAAFRTQFQDALTQQTNDLQNVVAQSQDDPAWRDQLKHRCTDLSDAATTLGYGLVAFVATHLRDACDAPGAAAQYENVVARHVEAMRRFASDEFRQSKPADVPNLAADIGGSAPKR